jgi:hypothetical protein
MIVRLWMFEVVGRRDSSARRCRGEGGDGIKLTASNLHPEPS